MSRILLIEDDEALAEGLVYALGKEGFDVETAFCVQEALSRLARTSYDLLLLDIGLPDGSGLDVLRRVRLPGGRAFEGEKAGGGVPGDGAPGDGVPVMFLTAADEEVSIIRALDSGGDDYIVKPFKLGELVSRIRALLRRAGKGSGRIDRLVSGDLTLDLAGCRATLGGKPLELTAAEYRLLSLLVRHEGRVVTREAILGELWDSGGRFVEGNTLSVYIRRLREKVEEDPSAPRRLITLR
ncbi:MAG: response regulator transcription factor [Clostridia bacterium]|nr:response regulator transcription factor [Clostridia bacterium]